IEGPPDRRTHAFDLRLAARPEIRRGADAGAFGGDPDRLAAEPFPLRRRASQKHRAKGGIEERVDDDPVLAPGDASRHRVMARERLRWKLRSKRGAYSFGDQPAEVRQRVAVEESVAKCIERHDDCCLALAIGDWPLALPADDRAANGQQRTANDQ